MRTVAGIVVVLLAFCISCTEYTPKPRGYFRIEPDTPQYHLFSPADLPVSFNLSQLATVLPDTTGQDITISYPSLNVNLYCSYVPVTPSTLGKVEEECRMLVARQSKNINAVREQAYSNPDEQVYGSLFLLEQESASPLQFMLTDSVSGFFRGALYYNCIPNADSLAPVFQYMKQDIIELVQSFTWKK